MLSKNTLRRIFFINLTISMVFFSICQAANPPEISARNAIVIEAGTGRIIYGKEVDARAYPASLTKMLTCIIAIEDGSFDKIMRVSKEAEDTEDPTLGLQEGEQATLKNLLKGMMLVSDNSSAVVIAEGLAGSTREFAQRMNDKAEDIGAMNSNFVTPNGLPHQNHYTTARDMARIAQYSWQNEIFRKIVGQATSTFEWNYPARKTVLLENTNDLLETYEGANGIKTGWTNAAGGCLAASAKRNGVQLIAVVLGSESTKTRFEDARKILDYGFSQVQMVRGVDKSRTERKAFVAGGENYEITAHPAEDVAIPLIGDEKIEDYSFLVRMPGLVEAPIKKGQKLGSIDISYKGSATGSVPILADNDVNRGYNPISMFWSFINYLAMALAK